MASDRFEETPEMSLEAEMLLDAKLIMRDGLCCVRPTAQIDDKGYVPAWRDNLLDGVDPSLIEADFGSAAGGELNDKFRAAHSSAALVVNVFGRFRDGQKPFTIPGLGQLYLERFERTFPTGLRRIPPHLDAVGRGAVGLVAIESKCIEYFTPKQGVFADAYLTLDRCRETPWFAEMMRLRSAPHSYQILNAVQLIKHAFGLINAQDAPATLLYLYWEPADAANHRMLEEHRAEIDQFARNVSCGGGPSFMALSYPELWECWRQSGDPVLVAHAQQLSLRYDGKLDSYEGYSRVNGRKTDAGFFGDDLD